MVGLRFLVSFCLLPALTIVALPIDKNGTDTKLKLLEETVSDIQKHMLAQEQKQTAVLSSVLSTLTKTTEELAQLQHNYTVLENELTSVKTNYTPVDGAGKGFTGPGVAFEAHMAGKNEHSHSIEFQANSNLIFPVTQYNEGGCLNSSNGVFTAPVNGTYMFWMNLSVRHEEASPFTIAMKRNEEEFGKVIRSDDDDDSGKLSQISLTPLVQGDQVKFVADQTARYRPSSSCGGVLLH